MKFRILVLPIAAVLLHVPAQASRMLGAVPPREADFVPGAAAPAPQHGVISATREAHGQGVEVQIDGRWLLAKRGRTQVLRNGLPLEIAALASGQSVTFSLASRADGETALGLVTLP